MPLVAAAVCPHPPMLVPEVAAGAAAELADLRAACGDVVRRLVRSGAERLVIVGADASTVEYCSPFQGSFARWGVPLPVSVGGGDVDGGGPRAPRRLPPGSPERRLPLGLLVGLWLVRDVSLPLAVRGVDARASADECARWGGELSAGTPWALLALGDGSACRGEKAPGYDDPRAEPFDATVAAALANADADALLALDAGVAEELRVAGRAAWQVLAGAVRASGRQWRGELSYHQAPYGVGYFVAFWEPA